MSPIDTGSEAPTLVDPSPAQTPKIEQLPFSRTAAVVSTYPVVASSLALYHESILGRLSASLYGAAVRVATPPLRVVVPLVEPIAHRPVTAAADLADRADSLVADKGLPALEARFPLVKAEPAVLKAVAAEAATWPLQLYTAGKTQLWQSAGYAEEQVRSRVLSIESWAASWIHLIREKVDTAATTAREKVAAGANAAADKADH